MPSSAKTSILAQIGLLTAIGLVMWIFEALIPYPFPFLKIGLGNIVVVIALYRLGKFPAFVVSLMRVILGALILGRLLSPSFLFSISGAFLSILIMIAAKEIGVFSIFGISIVGAFSHNIAQLIIAILFFYDFDGMIYFIPILGLSSIVGGGIIGYIAFMSLERLPQTAKIRSS